MKPGQALRLLRTTASPVSWQMVIRTAVLSALLTSVVATGVSLELVLLMTGVIGCAVCHLVIVQCTVVRMMTCKYTWQVMACITLRHRWSGCSWCLQAVAGLTRRRANRKRVRPSRLYMPGMDLTLRPGCGPGWSQNYKSNWT